MLKEIELNDRLAKGRAAKVAERRTVEIEASLDQISRWMDGLFRIPGVGWRFGLDAVIGLIPGVGDTATTLVSFYILAAGVRYRVPKITLLRMAANLGIDYLVGTIPFVGDAFDMFWKANQMNVDLIKERATVDPVDAKAGRMSDWLFVGGLMAVLVILLVGSIAASFLMIQFLLRLIFSAES
ncbi:MAG: DUF4112 domain-containing protein [Pyrinomonadaceae bacterium]